jgi:hypothetical protein
MIWSLPWRLPWAVFSSLIMFVLSWFLFLNLGILFAGLWAPWLLSQHGSTITIHGPMGWYIFQLARLVGPGITGYVFVCLVRIFSPGSVGIIGWFAFGFSVLVAAGTFRAGLYPREKRKKESHSLPKKAREALASAEAQRLAGILDQMSEEEETGGTASGQTDSKRLRAGLQLNPPPPASTPAPARPPVESADCEPSGNPVAASLPALPSRSDTSAC